jgi:hypothetical protein
MKKYWYTKYNRDQHKYLRSLAEACKFWQRNEYVSYPMQKTIWVKHWIAEIEKTIQKP